MEPQSCEHIYTNVWTTFPEHSFNGLSRAAAQGDNIILTYDNDFNVAEAAGIPPNAQEHGPFVQLELLGANYPRMYVIGR